MKFVVLLIFIVLSFSQEKQIPYRPKSLVVNGEVHANNTKNIVSNNGWLFWGGGASGLVVPSPVFSNNTGNFATVFASGIWIVGTINGEKRAAIANYSTDFIGGDWDEYMLESEEFGIDNPKYKIYYYYKEEHIDYLEELLEQNDTTTNKKVYEFALAELEKAQLAKIEWPEAVKQGAPLIPPGDVAAFCIYHDADDAQRQAAGSNGSKTPMNLQIRQLVYSYKSDNAVNNTIFIKYDLINKNKVPITDMFSSFMADTDIGWFNDDLIGSDYNLKIAYAYNGDPNDAQYTDVLGIVPPAVGYNFVQGAIVNDANSSIVARGGEFKHYSKITNNNPITGNDIVIHGKDILLATGMSYHTNTGPRNAHEYYNSANNWFYHGSISPYLQDAIALGLVDTTDNIPDEYFLFNGDPESQTGWLNPWAPMDMYFIFNMEPYDLGVSNGLENLDDPGFTTFTLAVTNSFGANNLNSVTRLKFDTKVVNAAYQNAFQYPNPQIGPEITAYEKDQEIALVWKDGNDDELNYSTESFMGFSYRFQGYQIVEFGVDDEEEIHFTFDLVDGLRKISNKEINTDNGSIILVEKADGKDSGIPYNASISRSLISGDTLLNNNSYSFGIRAYYYNPNPKDEATFAIYSDWSKVSLKPHREELGTEIKSSFNDTLAVDYSLAGDSDGLVFVNVIDPYKVTADDYTIRFDTLKMEKYHLGYIQNDTLPVGFFGWYLEKNGEKVTEIYPEGKTGIEYNYDLYLDGLRIAVTSPIADWKDFYVSRNANGPIDGFAGASADYNGFPGMGRTNIENQQSNGSTWFLTTGGNGERVAYSSFIHRSMRRGWDDVIPFDFEVRFNDDTNNYAYARYGGVVDIFSVPFELWNASLNVRMVPAIIDWEDDGQFNLRALDHEISGGTNDPQTDYVYWYLPTDMRAGESGYQAAFANGLATRVSDVDANTGHEVIARLVFVNWNGGDAEDATFPANIDAVMPESGTTFVLESNKINTLNTVFKFNGPGKPVLNDPKLAEKQFKKAVTVFPNPYYGFNPQQSSFEDRFITFANLPVIENSDKVKIDIFTLNGDIVNKMKYTGQSTEFRWDLRNSSGKEINNGLYIASLTYRGQNVIKKILIFKSKKR